jgi:hypothetical protein
VGAGGREGGAGQREERPGNHVSQQRIAERLVAGVDEHALGKDHGERASGSRQLDEPFQEEEFYRTARSARCAPEDLPGAIVERGIVRDVVTVRRVADDEVECGGIDTRGRVIAQAVAEVKVRPRSKLCGAPPAAEGRVEVEPVEIAGRSVAPLVEAAQERALAARGVENALSGPEQAPRVEKIQDEVDDGQWGEELAEGGFGIAGSR